MGKDAAISKADLRPPLSADPRALTYLDAYSVDEISTLSDPPFFEPFSERIRYAIARWRQGRSVAQELLDHMPVQYAKTEYRALVRWTFKFTGLDISKPRAAHGPGLVHARPKSQRMDPKQKRKR